MARGPSPGTVSGHLGEAEPQDRCRRAAAAAAQGPRRVGSSEDHLDVSWADFCFVRCKEGPRGRAAHNAGVGY
jgi:hypothetical protein